MWVLPSLNRPKRLAAALQSMRDIGVSTPGVVILGAHQKDDLDALDLPPRWTARCRKPRDKSAMAVLNRFFREHPDLGWYGFLQDDVLVRTPSWDVKMVAAAGRTNFCSVNDLFRAPKRMHAAVVFGGDLLRAMGFWAPPGIQHCYSDGVWESIARACGNWLVLMDVVVEHVHPSRPDIVVERDATYRSHRASYLGDRAASHAFRRSKEYERVIERVKTLSGQGVRDDAVAVVS